MATMCCYRVWLCNLLCLFARCQTHTRRSLPSTFPRQPRCSLPPCPTQTHFLCLAKVTPWLNQSQQSWECCCCHERLHCASCILLPFPPQSPPQDVVNTCLWSFCCQTYHPPRSATWLSLALPLVSSLLRTMWSVVRGASSSREIGALVAIS